jgi:hypothetical protein
MSLKHDVGYVLPITGPQQSIINLGPMLIWLRAKRAISVRSQSPRSEGESSGQTSTKVSRQTLIPKILVRLVSLTSPRLFLPGLEDVRRILNVLEYLKNLEYYLPVYVKRCKAHTARMRCVRAPTSPAPAPLIGPHLPIGSVCLRPQAQAPHNTTC